MNPIDIFCLIFILAGVIFIVRSRVHRHNGMWNLRKDDYAEPWDPINPKLSHYKSRRGIQTPYDETQIGVELIILGLLGFIYNTFGFWVCAAAVAAVSAASLVFNSVRLRRMDDDDELRTWRTVNLILSGFAMFIGVLVLFLT